MATHKIGYSVESLQKGKNENLEEELESQTKLINIKLIDMSDKLEKHNIETNNLNDTGGALRVQEILFCRR